MLVGDWERLPAGAEGLHEGIAKGGIKIADQDEGGGGIVGEQGLHESDKGFHFGGSEPQGIRVGRIVGKAAFQVQVEKPVRGAIQGKPDLLDTALQGAVGKPKIGERNRVVEQDLQRGIAGKHGEAAAGFRRGGESGVFVMEATGGEVELELLEVVARTDFLQEKDVGTGLEQQAADTLLALFRQGVVEAEGAVLEPVLGEVVLHVPRGDPDRIVTAGQRQGGAEKEDWQ